MKNKLIIATTAASVLFSVSAQADEQLAEKNLNVNVPITLGQESSVKSETLKYENLTKMEEARVKYLKAAAKAKIVNKKFEKGDFEGAAEGVVKKKEAPLITSFAPKEGMNPTMEVPYKEKIDNVESGNFEVQSKISKAEIEKQKIESDMPEITDISMVNGKVLLGVIQNGVNYAYKLNEVMQSGYKVVAVDSLTATVLKPSGKKVRVFVSGGNEPSSSDNNDNNSSQGVQPPSLPNSGSATPVVNQMGSGKMGAAGFPMGTTFK